MILLLVLVVAATAFYCLRRERARARQQSEAAQYRQLGEFFAIFDAIDGGAYVADMETHRLLAITGRDRDYFNPELLDGKCYERGGIDGDGPCPFCTNRLLVNPDGSPAEPVVREFHNAANNQWYLAIDRAIHWPDGRLVRLEVAINITARKEAEEALRRSEHNFRELVENLPVGILLIQDGEIVYQNPEQRRLLGGVRQLRNFAAVHPDDLGKVRESYRKIVGGLAPQVDLDFRLYSGGRRRGQLLWVYCRARPIDFQGRQTILVSMMDVSQAKELERLLRIQDKMSSLGRVAAGIAHEIRNPLSGINIYLGTLRRLYGLPGQEARAREILAQLEVASAKIEAVIRRVTDFARPGQPRFKAMEPNRVVQAALELTGLFLEKHGVVPQLELASGLPYCRADQPQIEQVLLNLITNSVEAMATLPAGLPRPLRLRTALQDEMVEIRVDDGGPGIEVTTRERVFDPFFTTKADGTGIGLNISQRIINDHGGRLEVVEGELGGAGLRILLPVT